MFSYPCTPENIANGDFYFAHHDPRNFVQCSEWGGCWVMPCAPGTEWVQELLTCDHAGGGGDPPSNESDDDDQNDAYDCGAK